MKFVKLLKKKKWLVGAAMVLIAGVGVVTARQAAGKKNDIKTRSRFIFIK